MLMEIHHFKKKVVDIFFPPDASNDFPISLQASNKYGIVYILTKYGFIHLYDMESGSNLFVNRITADPVFTASSYNNGTGLLTINKSGQVLSVEVSRDKIIPYVLEKLANVPLAISFSWSWWISRC